MNVPAVELLLSQLTGKDCLLELWVCVAGWGVVRGPGQFGRGQAFLKKGGGVEPPALGQL